ncbi:MAG: MBOAT family protein [Oscillospiraceae bacterium]|nr:MBOAT family protein [Oscillospiraceae bacterium]
MLFSSIPFLYYFLPVVLILYLITPKRFKNLTLLIASLFFYGWGEPKYVFLMLATIVCGYFIGLLIEKFRGGAWSKFFVILATVLFLGALGVFKYADFFIENFSRATGISVKTLGIALPIGISFYTFQILSYTIDVYRGDVRAQRNFISLAAYITMFPQLIAGPIVRYSDIETSLTERRHSFRMTAHGLRLFILGLAKKVLIANVLGELIEVFRQTGEKTVLFYWVYAVALCLHIYFDFSGYSDMARGLGKFFGFDFMENFNYPFISKSITEFWRRWHISLGTWFRDYVYIPLGGNRCGKGKHLFNILIVWMLTGFWHGAEWNFILWGLYFAILLAGEKFIWGRAISKSSVLSRIYVIFLTIISFIIFDSTELSDIVVKTGGLFGAGGEALSSAHTLYYLKSYALILAIALFGATPIPKILAKKALETRVGKAVLSVAEPILLAVLLIVITAYLVDGSFNPFLYFRF